MQLRTWSEPVPYMDITPRDRFAGCLLALAVGDSLGASFEGYPGEELIRAYLEGRYNVDGLRLGLWTDDTALTVATAQSIVQRRCVDGPDLAAKYLAWFESGGRGIGRSTRNAMRRLQNGTPWNEAGETDVMAAGNGVAMRIAPVGLLHARNLEGLEHDVRTCGIITHHNDEAIIGAECVAYAVARAADNELDPEGLGIELLARMKPSRCRDGVERALEAWQSQMEPVQALSALGRGGAAFETVPSALYCFWLASDDLERTICLSVLAGGDADTRAAIAGAIAGAYQGVTAIPGRWLRQLSSREGIETLAEALLELVLAD